MLIIIGWDWPAYHTVSTMTVIQPYSVINTDVMLAIGGEGFFAGERVGPGVGASPVPPPAMVTLHFNGTGPIRGGHPCGIARIIKNTNSYSVF